MDLRDIINSDASSATPARPPPIRTPPNQASPGIRNPLKATSYSYEQVATSGYQGGTRPPQPPPLQPPSQSDFRSPGSASFHSVQSPYQLQTPGSSLSANQYPFPLPPGQGPQVGAQAPPYPSYQGSVPTGYHSYGHPNHAPQTPTAPSAGNYYAPSNHQRPPSAHSSTTPTSSQGQLTGFPRDNSGDAQSRMTAPPQSFPRQSQGSLPGTPLGPPSTFGRFGSSLNREASGSFVHQRTLSGSSYTQSHPIVQSPASTIPGTLSRSPPGYGPGQQNYPQTNADELDRERSLSVSPKTRLPSQVKTDSIDSIQDLQRPQSRQVTPAKRKATDSSCEDQYLNEQPGRPGPKRVASAAAEAMLTLLAVNQSNRLPADTLPGPGQYQLSSIVPASSLLTDAVYLTKNPSQSDTPNQVSTTDTAYLIKDLYRSDAHVRPRSESSSVASSRQQPVTSQAPSNNQTPVSYATSTPPTLLQTDTAGSQASAIQPLQTVRDSDMAVTSTTPPPPRRGRKRIRHTEPPIFARRASRSNPTVPSRRQPPVKKELMVKAETSSANTSNFPATVNLPSNGSLVLPASVGVEPTKMEPSILNTIPYEEVTRLISDFLFTEVVLRDDVGAGPTGGNQGAVLEIEAKLGQLIDKSTNDRLRLPVMSECIISKGDPNLRHNFKSSMTQAQHSALNKFLNQALVDSKGLYRGPNPLSKSTKPRIPMSYVHTYECDNFYDLSQSGQLRLPPSIREQLNPRHNRAKVRITTNQKTGQEIAKIIKVRVADIDVFSPRTAFDWRLSVNLEMSFQGDMRELVEPAGQEKGATRNKDRMSYSHQAYQIDLTQVTPADPALKSEKEHELEIEVSSAEVRKQGILIRNGQENTYEDLIRGFVDNVRVLARHCQKE